MFDSNNSINSVNLINLSTKTIIAIEDRSQVTEDEYSQKTHSTTGRNA